MQLSGENYLGTIYTLSKETGKVHSVEVARALNFSKPSVSRAMGLLKDAGFIDMEKGGAITLTKTGLKKAKEIEEKKQLLANFLMVTVDIPSDKAEAEAGKFSYLLEETTFAGIKNFMKQVEECQ